ncbi:zinc finger protein 624-like isoform X4 [Helicoverpa zea]|uniref:zinc finger protein 624-like isoform X4 n=1 Tax=Helicoverpa zea TaxID=7113 RepID=UPI001F56BEFD|nr:zinc finger protein 624-like isoform X4 [Helicoverpa zea]
MLALLLLNNMSTKHRAARRKLAEKVTKTEEKTPEIAYCRTCLSTEDLVSIFYNKESEEKRSQDLRLVTGLEIKMDDGLSQKICAQCIETMNNALQFRRTSRKAEKTLLNMISGKPKKKYTTRLQKSLSKPKIKKAKVEKVELNDYSYEIFSEEFQNDDVDDYPVMDGSENSRSLRQKQPPKKKRMTIPNSSSYKCGTCGKEFRMKTTYKAHIRFHTNYCVCEACGKRCRNNNQLQEHKRARHGLYRIHKCAYCEYSSATKEALTIHERRHTGERPYVCDHCGATFHRRSNLVQHIAIHLPEKNFQCDMCPKRLKSRKFLQIHKHNAHTGKRYGYLCGICEHRFEKPNKVRAHMRRVHGVADEQQGPIARVQL